MAPRINLAAVLARAAGPCMPVVPDTSPWRVGEQLPAAGDLVIPLTADGCQIPDGGMPFPWLIVRIEPGPDGQQYALFAESDTGWPLTQCQPVPGRDPTAEGEDA